MLYLPEDRHCDRYLSDPSAPDCLRRFLHFHRQPAIFKFNEDEPTLWANLTRPKCKMRKNDGGLYVEFWLPSGGRVRMTMVSRFGDVGITPLDSGGYITRCAIDELTNFGENK